MNGVNFYVQWIARNLWGASKDKQSYKSRHRTALSRYIFDNVNLCLDRHHHTHTHTHTHGRLDSQKEGEQMRINGLAIPGAVGRPTQPSTIRGEKYWCLRCGSGRCGGVQYGRVQCLARENAIVSQLWMLFCASKGDDIEGWKEREREKRRCAREKIPNLVMHRSASVVCTSMGHSA